MTSAWLFITSHKPELVRIEERKVARSHRDFKKILVKIN